MTFNPFEAMNTGDWSGSKAPNKTAAKDQAPKTSNLKNTWEVNPREFPTCPSTTYEQAAKYGASPYTCGCPDRAKRDGGSYTGLDGRKACKHMIFHQKYYTDIAI